MNTIEHQAGQHSAETPLLRSLRLDSGQLRCLASQGSVHAEQRGVRTIHKLRFRMGSKQVVRYLGPDPDLAAAVQAELDYLQHCRVHARRSRELTRELREHRRAARAGLQAAATAQGMRFHGYTLRRTRAARSIA